MRVYGLFHYSMKINVEKKELRGISPLKTVPTGLYYCGFNARTILDQVSELMDHFDRLASLGNMFDDFTPAVDF